MMPVYPMDEMSPAGFCFPLEALLSKGFIALCVSETYSAAIRSWQLMYVFSVLSIER